MPSPVAHTLIGLSFGVGCLPRGGGWRRLFARMWRWRGFMLVCVLLANAPDIDYFFGLAAGDFNCRHQLITHTLGWVSAVTLALWWAQRYFNPRTVRMSGMLIFLLLASHLVADYFGQDLGPPFGIMIFWPLSDRFWLSPWPLFPAANKQDIFSWHNLKVMACEFGLLMPILAVVMLFKQRRSVRRAVPDACHSGDSNRTPRT